MPNANYINDPKHWRERTEQMRRAAADTRSDTVRETMLRIAADYDRLAERAMARATGRAPKE